MVNLDGECGNVILVFICAASTTKDVVIVDADIGFEFQCPYDTQLGPVTLAMEKSTRILCFMYHGRHNVLVVNLYFC